MQYRLRPYLRNSSEQELRGRLEDILRNVYAFTSDGKIGAIKVDELGSLWRQRLSDLELECSYRGIDLLKYGDVIENIPFKKETIAVIRRNLKLAQHVLIDLGYLGNVAEFIQLES